MPELSILVKISLFLYALCPILAIVIYFSPIWKRICDKFDEEDDINEEA